MALIVAVHGIGQQVHGEHSLQAVWLPALRDGLARAGHGLRSEADLACAFYGDLFRRPGGKAIGELAYDHHDVDPEWELPWLELLWAEAARVDPTVPGAGEGKGRAPLVAQRALRALASSRFFAGVAEHALIADLKQVGAYLRDSEARERVVERVAAAIGRDTRVVIGHSLGSVVAYEVLASASAGVPVLITLGSPLGIPNLVFERLRPTPRDGRGAWPGDVDQWVNVADRGDPVALVKRLAPLFDDRVDDRLVHNGAKAHDVRPYLTAAETGTAIAAGFAS